MVNFNMIYGLIYLEWESERRLVLDGSNKLESRIKSVALFLL